jgi:hypothetical protein
MPQKIKSFTQFNPVCDFNRTAGPLTNPTDKKIKLVVNKSVMQQILKSLFRAKMLKSTRRFEADKKSEEKIKAPRTPIKIKCLNLKRIKIKSKLSGQFHQMINSIDQARSR